MGLREKAEAVARPVIESLGFELVETSLKKEYGSDTLTFFIFKKGGVKIEDCEGVSYALDAALDDADVSSGAPYILNVSSSGLDREIKTDDDFRRSLDVDIEIIFTDDATKKQKTHGILVAYDDTKIEIEEKGKRVTYPKGICKTVRPYINFK